MLRAHALLATGLIVSLAGCYYPHDHCDDCNDSNAVPYDLWEIEPNDSHCCPDTIGTLYLGDQFVIGGTIRDDLNDPFDGFAFTSVQPMDITFQLEPVNAGADLDLGVFDPAVGDFVLIYDSPSSVETGVFTIPSSLDDFHLVVMSYAGDAEYRLSIWVDPPTAFASESQLALPSKPGRPIDVHLYSGESVVEEDVTPRMLDRGVVVEVDRASGDVAVRDVVVREDGVFVSEQRR